MPSSSDCPCMACTHIHSDNMLKLLFPHTCDYKNASTSRKESIIVSDRLKQKCFDEDIIIICLYACKNVKKKKKGQTAKTQYIKCYPLYTTFLRRGLEEAIIYHLNSFPEAHQFNLLTLCITNNRSFDLQVQQDSCIRHVVSMVQ